MARRGTGVRRAARDLARLASGDTVAIETAREHFVARVAEGDDTCAERAMSYLESALNVGQGITSRRPLRSAVRR